MSVKIQLRDKLLKKCPLIELSQVNVSRNLKREELPDRQNESSQLTKFQAEWVGGIREK